MNIHIDQPDSLPENVLDLAVSQRAWNGVSVDVAEFHCAGRVLHRLRHPGATRLSVMLEEVGGYCEPRLRADRSCAVAYSPRHMHVAPGGMEIWGYTAGVRFVRDANLIFDFAALGERLGVKLDGDAIATPRPRFSDDRIWTLVKLLADAVNDDDPATQLYGDGLTAAIAARLFCEMVEPADVHKGLAPRQLQRVVDYLQMRLPERVELAELASLAGLSQSHFSRAFKASTGMAPYRWQLDARVRRAQGMLLDTNASLDRIAEATGFADAVHFGRTFRKLTGATPASWRHDRKS